MEQKQYTPATSTAGSTRMDGASKNRHIHRHSDCNQGTKRVHTHNLVEITNKQQLEEISTYHAAHGCAHSLTILCSGEAYNSLGNTFSSAKITRNKTQKVENISLKALGDSKAVPWPRPAQAFDIKAIPQITRSTVRIAAPAMYRQEYHTRDSARLILTDIANWNTGIPIPALASTKWQKQSHTQTYTLVGFCKLPDKHIQTLVERSGSRGIFINKQEDESTRRHIQWFDKDKGLDTTDYFKNCLAEAQKHKTPLVYRKGGTSNLGIPCDAASYHKNKQIAIIARGVPEHWEAEEIHSLMEQQNWTEVKPINKRRKGKHLSEWLILAKSPSEQSTLESWHFQDANDGTHIHMVHAPPKKQHPTWAEQVKGPSRHWQPPVNQQSQVDTETSKHAQQQDEVGGDLSPSKANAPDAKRARSTEEIKPTQMDVDEATQTQHNSKPSTIRMPPPADPEEAIRQGWQEHNLGGNGDCAYRAAAFARKYLQNQSHMSPEDAKKAGASLRAEVVLHCQKHAIRLQEHFAPDSEETANQRNNRPAAQNFHEWIQNQSDPKTWACALSFQALAERTGMIITVWKYIAKGHWKRATFSKKFKNGQACCATKEGPIILLLKDRHFTALLPPQQTPVPSAWTTGESNEAAICIDLTGEGDRKDGNKTPSSASRQATSSISSPSVKTYKSRQTLSPSIHTYQAAPSQTSDNTLSVHTYQNSRHLSNPRKQMSHEITSRPIEHQQKTHADPRTTSTSTCTSSSSSASPPVEPCVQKPHVLATAGVLPPRAPRVVMAGQQQQPQQQVQRSYKQNHWIDKNKNNKQQDNTCITSKFSDCSPSVHTYQPQTLGRQQQQKGKQTARTCEQSIPETHQMLNTDIKRRICGKQPDPDSVLITTNPEIFTWTCRLCGMNIMAAGPRQLNWRRLNHLNWRHPDHQKDDLDKWKKFKLRPVICSEKIPKGERDWSCPWCDKGFRTCDTNPQRALSIRHHLNTEHQDIDTSMGAIHTKRAENRKKDPNSEPSLTIGCKNKAAAQKVKHAAKRDLTRNGHDLALVQLNSDAVPTRITHAKTVGALVNLASLNSHASHGTNPGFGANSTSKQSKALQTCGTPRSRRQNNILCPTKQSKPHVVPARTQNNLPRPKSKGLCRKVSNLILVQ